jgi:hypothetical protein
VQSQIKPNQSQILSASGGAVEGPVMSKMTLEFCGQTTLVYGIIIVSMYFLGEGFKKDKCGCI